MLGGGAAFSNPLANARWGSNKGFEVAVSSGGIRHKVNSDQYFQEIECIKDSVRQSYGSANKSYANIAGDEKRPVIPHDIENDTYS